MDIEVKETDGRPIKRQEEDVLESMGAIGKNNRTDWEVGSKERRKQGEKKRKMSQKA